MKVIEYESNHYTANVALVVNLHKTHDSRPMLLTSSGLLPAHTNQWQVYLSAVNSSKNDILTNVVAGKQYHIFTVDLLGYYSLYAKLNDNNNTVYDVFDDWQDILMQLLQLDMSCKTNLAKQEVTLSILNNSIVSKTVLSRTSNMRQYFISNAVSLTRFVNIAIPYDTSFNKVSFMFDYGQSARGTVEYNVLIQPETTYDTTDYSIVQIPLGQSFDIPKHTKQLQISYESFGEVDVVFDGSNLSNLLDLNEIVNITQHKTYTTLDFVYNANRDYTIVADTNIDSYESVPVNSMLIHSNDMLKHAKLIPNTLVRDKYIRSLTKHLTYTLPAVYEQKHLVPIVTYRWLKTNNSGLAYEKIAYGDSDRQGLIFDAAGTKIRIIDYSLYDFDRLTDFYYRRKPVQCGITVPSPNFAFDHKQLDKQGSGQWVYTVGNSLETYDFVQGVDIDLDTGSIRLDVLGQMNLPVINGNTVYFNNVEFVFSSNAYNKHVFCVAYRYDENEQLSYKVHIDSYAVILYMQSNNTFEYGQSGMIPSTLLMNLCKALPMFASWQIQPNEHDVDILVKLANEYIYK